MADGRSVRAWLAFTWAVYAVIGAYMIGGVAFVVLHVQDYSLVDRFGREPDGTVLAAAQNQANLERLFGVIGLLLSLGYLAALVAWFIVTRAVIRRRGADRSLLKHWSFTTWRLALIAMIVLALLGGRPIDRSSREALRESLLSLMQLQLVLDVARIAVVGVLLVAMWFIRERVRALIVNGPTVPDGFQLPPSGGTPVRGPVAGFRRWRDRRQIRVYD